MAHKPKANRAKQFAPFDALKGYREALRAMERIVVPPNELSEDSKEELDRRLHLLNLNDLVTVVYYDRDEYVRITGIVTKKSPSGRFIQIVNTSISFDDILSIEGDFPEPYA